MYLLNTFSIGQALKQQLDDVIDWCDSVVNVREVIHPSHHGTSRVEEKTLIQHCTFYLER